MGFLDPAPQKHTRDRRVHKTALGQCIEGLKKENWDVMAKGQPDLFCLRGTKLIVIQVKTRRSRRLKTQQRKVLRALSLRGIDCYRWDQDEGFLKIAKNIHDV